MEKSQLGITVRKEDDYAEWYSQVVQKADLADYAPIRGFMVIKPNAYQMWEEIQKYFDEVIKGHGVKNAYFPMLIPESFFKKEAEHAEGFSPELAWINRTDEDSDRLAIRPTSETIIYDSYSKWIRSHRDLPLKINQWCNVLRWEVKQTKPFMRTREFLWQEGHCVYKTEDDCDREVSIMLEEYRKLCEDMLAVPVIAGKKTRSETFAGAKYTLTVEAMMPDGKALQMGTSHNLGQGFARTFGIEYVGEDEEKHLPWQSSWGVSTRLIGGVIMTHGDDNGMIVPPMIARNKCVIVPIVIGDNKKVLDAAAILKEQLSDFNPILDDREGYKPGFKYNEWELKGIPLRIEIGPKDLENTQVIFARRDTGEKRAVAMSAVRDEIKKELDTIQGTLFRRAKAFLKESVEKVTDWVDFVAAVKEKKLVLAPSDLDEETEEKIKEETNATSRCIPLEQESVEGFKDVKSGKPAKAWVYYNNGY